MMGTQLQPSELIGTGTLSVLIAIGLVVIGLYLDGYQTVAY
jgi:hypothetical protein